MTTAEEHLFLRSDIEYNTNLSEIEFLNRYYLYAEYIVSPRSDVTTWNVTFTFGDNGTVDNASYLNTVVKIDGKVSTKQITVTGIYNGTTIGTCTFKYGELDPMVFSIMILPKLNVNNEVTQSVDEKYDIANLCVFHNGHQVLFYDNSGLKTTLLPLVKFYSTDSDENKEEFIATNNIEIVSSAVNYVICNTEFDKFMYQWLALMCYDEYNTKITTLNTKNDILTVPTMNYGAINIPLNGMTCYKSFTPYFNMVQFPMYNTNGIKFYCEIHVSVYGSASSEASYANMSISLSKLLYDHYNLFDSQYRPAYSNLESSKWTEITDIEANILESNLFNMERLNVPVDDNMIGACLIVISIEKTNSGFIINNAIIDRSSDVTISGIDLPSGTEVSIKSYDEIEYNIPITLQEHKTVSTIDSGTTFALTACENFTNNDGQNIANNVRFVVNCGEKKFHTIPTTVTEDSDDYKFLNRSQNSDNWRSLWKYNRDIDFSSDLQDNPIILPLNIIKNSTDNMFVEMILNSAGTLNDGVCFGIIDYPVFNGVSDINPGVTQYGNGFTLAIYPSTTYNGQYKTVYQVYKDGSEIYKYEEDNKSLPISIMYYKNNSTGKIVCRKNVGEEDINIAQVDSTTMKNIYIHGNGTCNCTLNFGPTSDTFQDYIDELLSYDTYNSNLVDLSYYARDNITDYKSITSIPQENLDYLNSGLYASNMTGMFYDCGKLTYIPKLNIDTTNVNDMNTMFRYCDSLTSLDLSDFNTSNVTNMSYMFYYCSSLTSLDLSNFDTSKVEDMSNMFYECHSLNSLIISNFNTSKVKTMHNMFTGCFDLTSLDLSNFNTSNVTSMSYMFEGCPALSSLNVSNFNTSNVTDMGSMFSGCNSLTSLDVSNFDTSKVTDMSYMFYGCKSLTSLDISNFDTSKVTNMSNMFENCSVSGNLYLKNLTIIEACKYAGMFKNINISGTFEIGVKYIYGDDFSIFASGSNLYECENKIHIKLDLENQTNIGMFSSLSSSKELKVSNTSNSSLTNIHSLFSSMNLKSLDLSNFNTSKITNMTYLFSDSEILSINGLSNFDTKNITDMEGMFENFQSYSLDLTNWNTENLISTLEMFKGSKLTILHIFSTENVQDMSYMFMDSNILTIDGIISMKSCKNYQNMFYNNSLTEKVYLTNVPEDFDPGLAGFVDSSQYEIVS